MLVTRIGEDEWVFDVPDWLRQLVHALATQLDDELDGDNPLLVRLFPTAYPDDAELEAGYQVLGRSELIDNRSDSIATVSESLDAETVDGETLDAWMRVVNDLRLVLGTQLDVSEDPKWTPDPRLLDAFRTYTVLGRLLDEIVVAQLGDEAAEFDF